MDDVLNIVCVHRELESDLELWETLRRSLSSVRGRYLLVVGSGEKAAHVSGHGEAILHSPGKELEFASERLRNLFENEIRAAGKKIIQNFTDAGIASVGVIGTDRGLLKRDDSGDLRLGELGSIIALTRSGVVSVLMAAATDTAGNVVDINPLHVALSIELSLDVIDRNTKGQILLLLSKKTDISTVEIVDGRLIDTGESRDFPGTLPAVARELTLVCSNEIRLLTPSELGKAR